MNEVVFASRAYAKKFSFSPATAGTQFPVGLYVN
jgi:hypothetical protein